MTGSASPPVSDVSSALPAAGHGPNESLKGDTGTAGVFTDALGAVSATQAASAASAPRQTQAGAGERSRSARATKVGTHTARRTTERQAGPAPDAAAAATAPMASAAATSWSSRPSSGEPGSGAAVDRGLPAVAAGDPDAPPVTRGLPGSASAGPHDDRASEHGPNPPVLEAGARSGPDAPAAGTRPGTEAGTSPATTPGFQSPTSGVRAVEDRAVEDTDAAAATGPSEVGPGGTAGAARRRGPGAGAPGDDPTSSSVGARPSGATGNPGARPAGPAPASSTAVTAAGAGNPRGGGAAPELHVGPPPAASPGPLAADGTDPSSAATGESPGSPPGESPPSVAEQVLTVLSPLQVSDNGAHSVTLQLEPAGLGSVQATVTVAPQLLMVGLWADSPEGHAALAQTLGQLHGQLAGDGGQNVSVDLADFGAPQPDGRGGQAPPGDDGVGPRSLRAQAPSELVESVAVGGEQSVAGGGRMVDLHL